MLPFLYWDLKSLVSSILKLFIKSSVVKDAKTGCALTEIDLTNSSNWIPNKELGLGFAAEAKLKEHVNKDVVSSSQL